jgi:hypothetical protein
MSYENEYSSDTEKGDGETYFCLYGKDAKEYFKCKIGDRVKLTVEAVITELSVDEDNEPVAEFRVVEVEGKRKPYDEMSASEMEREIHDVYNEESEPNREDGESIWKELRDRDRVNEQPFTRPKSFSYR